MPADPLVGLSLVLYRKDKRVYHITSRKSNEYKLLIEFFLLVDSPTDHYRTAYYR